MREKKSKLSVFAAKPDEGTPHNMDKEAAAYEASLERGYREMAALNAEMAEAESDNQSLRFTKNG